MNWELSRASKHKCPCGQGTYTVRTFLDDWNRSEEQWDMDCLKCRRKYDLYSSTSLKSGKLLRTNRWMKKGDTTADGAALAGREFGPGDKYWGKRLEGVKANGFAQHPSNTGILKDRF